MWYLFRFLKREIYWNIRNVEYLINNGVLFSTLIITNTSIDSNMAISCKTDNLNLRVLRDVVVVHSFAKHILKILLSIVSKTKQTIKCTNSYATSQHFAIKSEICPLKWWRGTLSPVATRGMGEREKSGEVQLATMKNVRNRQLNAYSRTV